MIGLALALAAPTAEQGYIGCYLLTQGKDVAPSQGPNPDPDSAEECAMLAKVEIDSEMAKPDSGRLFCFPPEVIQNPYKPMAQAYVDFYREHDPKFHKLDSVTFAHLAAGVKWACFPK